MYKAVYQVTEKVRRGHKEIGKKQLSEASNTLRIGRPTETGSRWSSKSLRGIQGRERFFC